jgi:hypothetical protein
MKFKIGDIVRHTGKFLRSIGMYTGAPINGRIVGFSKIGGMIFPLVEWSDDMDNPRPVHPNNLELDPRYRRR